MTGTVLLVYAAKDKKHESSLDVYHFIDAKSVFVISAKRICTWSMKSPTDAAIEYLSGEINLTINYATSFSTGSYAVTCYGLVLSGKPEIKGNKSFLMLLVLQFNCGYKVSS